MAKKKVLITGVSRGLGLGVCQALQKDSDKFELIGVLRKKESFKADFPLHLVECELSDEVSREKAIQSILKDFGSVDILINNAGVFLDDNDSATVSALPLKLATLRKTFEVNTVAPFHFIQAFLPGMLKHNFGRIVNVSSGMGQLSKMKSGYPAYRVSKTALNAVTAFFADEVNGKDVIINSVCPGWVRTDMGGAGANRSIDEGIVGILWAMNLSSAGASGGFFRDGKEISW